ncbi:hypothetical protein KAU45_04290, partial [bacterium]|nr:hypothetical protein [bacterium]
ARRAVDDFLFFFFLVIRHADSGNHIENSDDYSPQGALHEALSVTEIHCVRNYCAGDRPAEEEGDPGQ